MLYLSVNVTSKFKCMNVNIWISRLKISRYFQELSQLYLELVDACKKRFMTQIRRVAVLKRSPVWKKMRKSFKTLSELKLKFIPKTWKQEAMAQKTPPKTTPPPLKGWLLKIDILTRLLIIWFDCLKTWMVNVYLWDFFSTSKKRNKWYRRVSLSGGK